MPPYCRPHNTHHTHAECEYQRDIAAILEIEAAAKKKEADLVARGRAIGTAAYAAAHGVPVYDVETRDAGLEETIRLVTEALRAEKAA